MRRDEFPIVHMAIKDAVVKALEDVKAEIETKKEKEVVCIEEDLINGAFDDALDIIDRKIAEMEGDMEFEDKKLEQEPNIDMESEEIKILQKRAYLEGFHEALKRLKR